ncbi:MAG: methyltransferase domain-containing protein [Tatlockia sp.]|nr:methyltransferase domain-containing protein [Tatlockia sp.]
MLNDYVKFINFYIDDIKGTGYLAFRDLPLILNKNAGKKALDFGCGAGRSSKYLERLGYYVTGIDINAEIINSAKLNSQSCEFLICHGPRLPFDDNTFDLVFNSFVLFDISSKEQITSIFKELKRVCKKEGEIVSVVNSNYLFTKRWLTVDNNFEENLHLDSGDIARILLSDLNIEIYDYYWTNDDYEECFKKADLTITNKHQPLGYINEVYEWLDELNYPPYSIYVCK